LLVFVAALSLGAELRVDCGKQAGTIRALHGGNCGPVNYGEMVDVSAYHKEVGIPYIRLHDCHWPVVDVVDMHVIFPDLNADPSKPESYNFERTDDYLQSIVKTGAKIIFRLGESIEHTKKKLYVHPPKDYEKWAAACVGIVRHYNDGWANGFKLGIKYWEIWNEPEVRPQMWSGTDEDYLRLYGIASKAIKARFPDVFVGGPGASDAGNLKNGTYQPPKFGVKLLEYCKLEGAPLDFFSWHRYTPNPQDYIALAKGVRGMLDRYGFTKTESQLNEWNYLPGNDWGPMMLQGQGPRREKMYDLIGGAQTGKVTVDGLDLSEELKAPAVGLVKIRQARAGE
jgi:hypothetical protein